ncbi:MAG TPA: hypothetical protein VFM12_04900 [Gemmatimonadales bacterium]|nr:hypothetical protein [Gemmatimonadales bacterium]
MRAVFVVLILSGVAGVVVGDTSADAGWWLIVLFSALLLLTFRGKLRRARPTNQP